MRYLNGGNPITADGTGDIEKRENRKLSGFLVDAQLKYVNSTAGSLTVDLKDGFTDEVVATATIGANEKGSTAAFKLPFSYYYDASGASGGPSVVVAVDGDA